MLSPKIETERLVLRRYEETDIDMQYETLADERLHKYIKFPNLTKEEELKCIKEWILSVDIDKHEKWVIVLKENNKAIGNVSVNDINKKTIIAMLDMSFYMIFGVKDMQRKL